MRIDGAALHGPELSESRTSSQARYYPVQISEVEFVDSTGVGLLIHLQKQLRGAGFELVLIVPNRRVRRALDLMGLQEFFLIAPDETAARRLIESRQRQEPLMIVPALTRPGGLLWKGEITAANAEAAWKCISTHLDAASPQEEWQIDLSRLDFIDSSGLTLLLRAKELASHRDHRLRFVNPQPAVRNVVRLGRQEEVLLDKAA